MRRGDGPLLTSADAGDVVVCRVWRRCQISDVGRFQAVRSRPISMDFSCNFLWIVFEFKTDFFKCWYFNIQRALAVRSACAMKRDMEMEENEASCHFVTCHLID